MADTDRGSPEPIVCRSPAQLSASLCTTVPRADTTPNAAAVLDAWNEDIERAARSCATRLGGGRIDADDLAQVARIRLWHASHHFTRVPAPYARRVIANAVRSGIRREGCIFGSLSTRLEALDEQLPAPEVEYTNDLIDGVERWLGSLPPRLRQLYNLLYVEACTQREAATILGVSQARIAQLHRDLLRRGQGALAHLAA